MSQKFTGTVIGLKSAKTATVELISVRLHPKYHKPEKIKTKKLAHYEVEEFPLQLGDKVVIKSSRPYSKNKKFLVVERVSVSR